MAIYIPPGGKLIIDEKKGTHRVSTPVIKSLSKAIIPQGGAPKSRKTVKAFSIVTPTPSRRGSTVDVIIPKNISLFDTKPITPTQSRAREIYKKSSTTQVYAKPSISKPSKPNIVQMGMGFQGLKTILDIFKTTELTKDLTNDLNLPGGNDMAIGAGALLGIAGAGYGLEQAAEALGVRGGAGFIGQAPGTYGAPVVIKTWSANGTPFQLMSDGYIVVTKKNGMIKRYKPYKPVVFGKTVDAVKFARLAKKYNRTYKDLHKVFGKRTRRS